MTLFEIPDFLESAFQEQLVRDAAFLGLRECVNGFDLEPLTLRRYLILKLGESPLLGDAPAGPYDMAQFLWVMSPKYRPGNCLRRRLFLRVRCRRLIRDIGFLMATINKCREYVRDSLTDCPTGAGRFDKSYYSSAAWICWRFKSFASEAQTLDMPIAKMFQYLKLMDAEAGRILTNPRSEGVIAKWQAEQQKQNDARRTAN